MIELRAAVKLGKHIQPLMDLEASRGGLTRDEVCNQILAADAHYAKWGFVDGPRGEELCAKLFERQPIEWNRIGAFQDVTMRMIAAGALGEENAPGLATSSRSRTRRRSKSRRSGGLDAAELAEATYLEQETAHKSVELPPPEVTGRTFHCFISSSNPGAVELLEEVALKMKMEIKTTTDIADLPACGHMLVYLTGETWTGGARSDSLALDVNAAMDAGTHLLLAHEMPGMQGDGQDARHGVEFGTFFACSDGATPPNLIQANIYGQIAVALKGGPWRVASMVLMAQGIASGMEVEPLSLSAASSLAVLKAAFKFAPRPRPKVSPLNSVVSALSNVRRGVSLSCGQQLRLPPRAAHQQHVQRKLSSNKSSAVGLAGHGCALDLLSRMRAAVHDKGHSDADAVVGSTGLVREGAPLGQIQRASSLPIQRGARSQVIRRAKSHSIQRTRINTQLTLQPVDKGVAGSSSSHAAGTVGGTVGSTAGGSEGGPEVAMGLRGCALQAALTPRAAPLVSRCV